MKDSKNLDHLDEFPNKSANKEIVEIKNKEKKSISEINNQFNENKELKINLIENNIDKGNSKIVEANTSEDNEKVELNTKLDTTLDNNENKIEKSSKEIIKENALENIKLTIAEPNLDKTSSKLAENVDKSNEEVAKEKNLIVSKKVDITSKSNENKNNPKATSTSSPVKAKPKPVKEPPIEKKPFIEFVNDYLIPEIKNEFKLRGKEVNKINLQKTNRPIAEDICWVIYCEINDTCNFWLSFEKEDITSLKSFSLCKNYEKPSIIESFLIDEKKITLKLIISRILQRLNGQKLIGAN